MAKLPAAIIGGGETTVTLVGKRGTGGRNQELALAAALHLQRYSLRNVVFASAGTDGTDGPTDAAGAVVDGGTVDRLNGEAEQALQQHDAYTYFKQAGTGNESPLIVTGPTGTNVADVCVTLIR
jgi:glycerate-2-kinase